MLQAYAYVFGLMFLSVSLKLHVLQEKFYNKKTINMSRSEIVEHIIDFVTASVGNAYSSAIKSGFNDRKTDLKTRVSFEVRVSESSTDSYIERLF